MVEIDAAKLQEMKLKYGIDALDMEGLAGAHPVEEFPIPDESALPPAPREEAKETFPLPTMGNQGDDQSALIKALSSGDSSINDVLGIVIVMDYLDRMSERRDDRKGGGGQGSDMTKLLETIERNRVATDQKFSDMIGTFEKTMLGKERDDAVERANRLQDGVNQRAEQDRLQGAVDSAVGKVVNYYEDQIDDLRGAISYLPADQQKGFFAELFEELGDELKSDVKDQFLSRLRGDAPPSPISTDEDGRTKIDYGHFIGRTIDLLESFVTRKDERPPLKPVSRMREPDKSQSFLDDGGEEEPEAPPVALSDEDSEVEASVQEVPEEPVEAVIESISEPVVEEAPSGPIIHGGLQDREQARERRAAKTVIPLEEISGIGPAYAEGLRGRGINDVETLSSFTPPQLAELFAGSGVTEEKTKDWITQAKDRMDSE